MLTVVRVHLPSDIPIVGCELTPYVLLRLPDSLLISDDIPESAPVYGCFLRYKWSVSSSSTSLYLFDCFSFYGLN